MIYIQIGISLNGFDFDDESFGKALGIRQNDAIVEISIGRDFLGRKDFAWFEIDWRRNDVERRCKFYAEICVDDVDDLIGCAVENVEFKGAFGRAGCVNVNGVTFGKRCVVLTEGFLETEMNQR